MPHTRFTRATECFGCANSQYRWRWQPVTDSAPVAGLKCRVTGLVVSLAMLLVWLVVAPVGGAVAEVYAKALLEHVRLSRLVVLVKDYCSGGPFSRSFKFRRWPLAE